MKLLALLALAATLSAQTRFDSNGALEAFYHAPKHHWYQNKKLWEAVGAASAGLAIGFAINSTHSAGPMYHSQPVQYGAPVPDVSVTNLGIGGPGLPVVVVHK